MFDYGCPLDVYFTHVFLSVPCMMSAAWRCPGYTTVVPRPGSSGPRYSTYEDTHSRVSYHYISASFLSSPHRMYLLLPHLPASVGPGNPRPRTLPILCPGALIGGTGVRPGSLSLSSMSPPTSILKRFWRGTRSRRWLRLITTLSSTRLRWANFVVSVMYCATELVRLPPDYLSWTISFPLDFILLVKDDCDIPVKRTRHVLILPLFCPNLIFPELMLPHPSMFGVRRLALLRPRSLFWE